VVAVRYLQVILISQVSLELRQMTETDILGLKEVKVVREELVVELLPVGLTLALANSTWVVVVPSMVKVAM
jgi:hypothetical protein